MSKLHHTTHLLKETVEVVKDMEPLKDKKNPFTAAAIGFFFGPFGIGLYFGSWKDFFLCLGVLILLMFTVALTPVGWLFSAAYGFYRATTSNEKGH
jgi:hypothetical protein